MENQKSMATTYTINDYFVKKPTFKIIVSGVNNNLTKRHHYNKGMEKEKNLYSEIKKKKKTSIDDGKRKKIEGTDLSIPPSTIKMIENAGDSSTPTKAINIPKLQIYAKISDYNLKNDKIEIIKEKSDIDFGFNFISNSGAVIHSNCAFNHVFKPEDTIKKIAPTILAPLYQLLFNGLNVSLIYMGSLGNDKTQFLYQNTIKSNYGFFLHTLQWAFSLLSTYLKSNSLLATDAYLKISALHFSQRNNTITDLMSIFTENFEPKKNPEFSNTSFYDNISDIYENDDDIDRICKEMKKTETLKEIHIPTLEDGIHYFKKIMEFQNLGDDDTQRTEHTFYFINLYRKQKQSKNKEKKSDETEEFSIIKSTLTLIDMGLGERKSKGDPTIITMPGISNILQLIFQGHKHLLTRNSLFTSLLQEYLKTPKNKTAVILTNFSPGDRVNDQANLFHLFCKLFKITNGSKNNSHNKNITLNDNKYKNKNNDEDILKNNQKSETLSEFSGGETVIYLGEEVISRSSLLGGSENDKTLKGSNSDSSSKKSIKNKIISSTNAIPIDFPPTIEKQMLAGYRNINYINELNNLDDIKIRKNSGIKNLKDTVIETVFGEEYISKEREYMIWKWMKDNQKDIDSQNIIFENFYAEMDKQKKLKKSDISKTDSGIQCDDNEIDHEQMKLWITGRYLEDITEVDEEISCKSNALSRKSKTCFEIGQSMPREALAEKTFLKDEGCSVDKILSPLRILKNSTLKNEHDLSQLSLEDISLNDNGNSEDDFECESIPDDDLEKAMEASLNLSSIKSHEILSRMNKNIRNSLIHNPIIEEKSIEITNCSTQPSDSTTPSDTAFYRKASYLEMYAEEKLNEILDKEEAENKKKKQNIIGKKIKNVLSENILKCCDKNGTISIMSKNGDAFVYDSSSNDNTYSKKSFPIITNDFNRTDSMYPINGSMNKGFKLLTSPTALKCCFSPMVNSETSITSGEFSKQPSPEDNKEQLVEGVSIKESKIPVISEEDRQQIKEQLVSYNKKQKTLTNLFHPRQHSSLPITPLKKLSLQSPLKRIEEAENKIKSQGGGTTPTSSATILNTFASKDNISNCPRNRNSRSNSIDVVEGFENDYFTKNIKKNIGKGKDRNAQETFSSSSCNNTIKRFPKQCLNVNNNRKSSNLPILMNSKLPPSPYSKITSAKMVNHNNGTVSSSGHGSDEAEASTTFKSSSNGLSSGNNLSPVFSKTPNIGASGSKGKNRESFSASSGYESADYQNIHYNFKHLNIKQLKRTSTSNNIFIDGYANETIKMIKDEQETLKKELKEAQQRIQIFGSPEEEEMSLSDEKVFDDVDKDTIIQTLLTENKVLRKRILAARNHVMMITSFL
ncbi:Kinesin-like protein CG14535 [Strongyloides ratti]|uniref:Kinesin-like protein CG14535 n=1 Tax=Strongyloides ratti TaxID=34506 RepID=A0A090LI57_STRRB|nr:Kinesin-like protein CG14535 [Strongyloides ratti]CEF69501.1 Kinesin-like protein CG14535 [Strongyloides ratti]